MFTVFVQSLDKYRPRTNAVYGLKNSASSNGKMATMLSKLKTQLKSSKVIITKTETIKETEHCALACTLYVVAWLAFGVCCV